MKKKSLLIFFSIVYFPLSALPSLSPSSPLPLSCLREMKDTRKAAKQATSSDKPTPRQRQRSLLESLGVTVAARPPPPPPPPPLLLPGQQRSLDGLAKVVRKNKGEEPRDVLSRCLGTLRGYQLAVGRGGGGGNGGGGGAGNNTEGGATGTTTAAAASNAASSPSPPSSPTTTATTAETATATTEDQARAALRELSCVRVDASLIAASGAGAALRRFRKDPGVAVSLSVQAEKILESWKEAVTSEVRARKKLRAKNNDAAASLGEGRPA